MEPENDTRHVVSPRVFSELVLWLGTDTVHAQYRTWEDFALTNEIDDFLDELARQ